MTKMIKIFVQNSRYSPIIVCDICGRKIDNAMEGAAVFNNRTPSGDLLPDGAIQPVIHAHKGKCHDLAESKVGEHDAAVWIELETHVRFLVHNTGLDLKQMLDKDRLDEVVGTL